MADTAKVAIYDHDVMTEVWERLIPQGREKIRPGTGLLDTLDLPSGLAWPKVLSLHGILEIRRVDPLDSQCELVYTELNKEVDGTVGLLYLTDL